MPILTRNFSPNAFYLFGKMKTSLYPYHKKNEDINPTKASHPSMDPDHCNLALEEVDKLLNEDLIEKTTSPWACEAFMSTK